MRLGNARTLGRGIRKRMKTRKRPRRTEKPLKILLSDRTTWATAFHEDHIQASALRDHLNGGLARPARLKIERHLAKCLQCQISVRHHCLEPESPDAPSAWAASHAEARITSAFRIGTTSVTHWNPTSWDATHAIANALQGARRAGVTENGLLMVLNAGMTSLERALERMARSSGAHVDDLHSGIECIEEAAFIACLSRPLSLEFARLYVRMVARSRSRLLKILLAYLPTELTERGRASIELARLIVESLAEVDDSPEVLIVLGMLLTQRKKELDKVRHSTVERILSVSRTPLAETSALIQHSERELHSAVSSVLAGGRISRILPPLEKVLAEIRQPEPLRGILGLGSARLVLKSAMRQLSGLSQTRRRDAVSMLCNNLFEPITGNPEIPAMLSIEAAEVIVDEEPGMCADVMGDLFLEVDSRFKQGFFTCLLEALEEKHAGRSQKSVPRFLFQSDGTCNFVSGPDKEFGPFGQKIAALFPEHEELRRFPAWAEQRAEVWLS
jgi:hypothetical protein